MLPDLSDALDEIETAPPNNNHSRMFDIMKSLKDDRRQNMMEIVDKKEHGLLKNYLPKIRLDSTVEDAVKVLDKITEKSDDEVTVQIIENIVRDLRTQVIPLDVFVDFAEKFASQDYPLGVFYKQYFKRSPIPQITADDLFGDIDDMSSNGSEEYTVRRVTKPVNVAKLIDAKNTVLKKGRVVVVNRDVPIPEVVVADVHQQPDTIHYGTMKDVITQDCEFLYKKVPWVVGVVNQVYVHPVEGDFEGMLDYEKFIVHDNHRYYHPKKGYYSLQCHADKVQEGHLLTVFKDGRTYKLYVAVDTNTKGVVLQNEDMLNAEVNYLKVWNSNKKKYIENMMRNKPNEFMILYAKSNLMSAIQLAIGGNVPAVYNSYDERSFVSEVVETMVTHSDSGTAFLRLLSNLIIFLKVDISFVSGSVFAKRLKQQVYLPSTLPFLTDANKLPEIFLVQNVPDDTKNFVLKKLNELRVNFETDFCNDLYSGSTLSRVPMRPVLWNNPAEKIKLPDLKTICKNKEDIEDEAEEDLVFYTDLDEVYCFSIYKLHDTFEKNEGAYNPYTRRPFTDEFIRIFLTRYAKAPRKSAAIVREDLTVTLEKMIDNELTILENALITSEAPDFIELFNNSMVLQKPTTGVKCFECKKECGPDAVETFFRNKKITFCGYECLEKNKSF
jgi:hypothetical protein